MSVDRGNGWNPVALSFVAGVGSASILWYAVGGLSRQADKETQIASIRQWWLRDVQSRIGELPSLRRRSHWPWDRRNRGSGSTPNSSNSNSSHSHKKLPDHPVQLVPPSPGDEKTGLCIGSIFGLDVGGTLAKLVYFEQKSEPNDPQGTTPRERTYRSSASAQAVVMARRASEQNRWPLKGRDMMSASTSSISSGEKVWVPPRIRRRSVDGKPMTARQHSDTSQDDLHALNMARQESLPDDLHAYADAVYPSKVRSRTTDDLEDHPHQSSIFRESNGSLPDPSANSNPIRKSRSNMDFSHSQDHADALDRFYNFARRLDSYREGVRDHKLSFYSRELGGEFHFIRFETRRMPNAMALIRANNLHLNICEVGVAGGGAHKFAKQWEQELGIQMKKEDELESLVAGMQFVLSTVVGECYTFRPRDTTPTSSSHSSSKSSSDSMDGDVGAPTLEDDDETAENGDGAKDRGKGDEWSRKVQRDAISYSSTYPYLLVTIGTGVSILRVDGPRKHVRVSGSTIGGGTYLGLIRLLTDSDDFDAVMHLAERGDPSKVDMMVGDIYGENSDALEKIGLPANLVASSFGKLVAKEDPALGIKEEDLARALLLMVTNNIGQVAYLNAQLHNTPRIYFVGNFLRQNKISQRRLSYAIDYWSKGEMEALFLEHEGYFGALGAFLLSQDIPHDLRKVPKEGVKAKSKPMHRRSNTVAAT